MLDHLAEAEQQLARGRLRSAWALEAERQFQLIIGYRDLATSPSQLSARSQLLPYPARPRGGGRDR